MKTHILFIINPIAGGKDKAAFAEFILRRIDLAHFAVHFKYTKAIGQAYELAKEALSGNVDIVVAVGGDGTVNEIAAALEGSSTRMAILPCGSGNGLARSLGIPLNLKKALERLSRLHCEWIDSAQLNGRKFFNTAGIGFDAQVSARFAQTNTRGLKGYIKAVVLEVMHYQPQSYSIEVDRKVYTLKAFSITIANSPQFGNGAYISPEASLTDGLLDICIIKLFPRLQLLSLVYRLLNKTIHQSKYVQLLRGKEITIRRKAPGPVHVDGEAIHLGTEINVRLKPKSLCIIS